MAILLKPSEQVIFPQPYLPGEANELVITNQRLIRITDAGMADFGVGELTYVGRSSERPRVVAALVLGAIGLALCGVGLYSLATANWSKEKAAAIAAVPAPPLPGQVSKALDGAKKAQGAIEDPAAGSPPAAADDDEGGFVPIVDDKLLAGLMTVAGLVLGVVAWLLARRERHLVNCRMGERAVELECKDKTEQTMILATLSSAVSASRLTTAAPAAEAPAPAPPPVEVDDKGDPVKALQDLKADRDAGKVDLSTYEAKREILLQRLAAQRRSGR